LFLNNKLYCRLESAKPRPFVVLNPITLEETKEEVELDKEDQNLEWKENEDTGRSLTYSPLISDGNYIYVIAQKKAPKKSAEELKEGEEAEQRENESSKPPMFVVEQYDPSTPSFTLVRETFLYKNEDLIPFMKNNNSVDFLKNNSFATNGQIFFI
jgi:hypothetical protein